MELIHQTEVQNMIDKLTDQDLYIHLELTTGAYASHHDISKHPAANFITNAQIRYTHGSISGNGTFRVGLKMEHGWIYAEGLTHYDKNESERLVMAGHDSQGKLVVALQLSREPF
ncbi:YojF family protein [Paenibacillus sp. EC2-1]|uniref:YojF family protein n=1 Tax=Paenibacillus sp. EC2-1 TaxID=3388665 RepID=UPI003BEF22E8